MMKRVFQALVCRLLFKHHINQFNGSLISCPAEALKAVVEAAKTGVSVLSLCEKGDAFIVAETGKIFKREKEMKKGIFFLSLALSFFWAFHYLPIWLSTPSFTLFPSQVSLFLHAFLLTTACAISPLWRVILKSYWRMAILSKCKLLILCSPSYGKVGKKHWKHKLSRNLTTSCLRAVISVCTSTASSQTWLTASLSAWPRYEEYTRPVAIKCLISSNNPNRSLGL